jgi:predicted tellurium resistance membrane protein TerC
MGGIIELFSDPAAWAALVTLVVMEIVLGIDNLIFISILSNKLPEHQRQKARRVGIGLALIMRLVLLSTIAWIVGLTAPVFDLGIAGGSDGHGGTAFETQFSWRDLILIAGGLFLVWKATKEIHHNVDPAPVGDVFDTTAKAVGLNFGAAIFQIILLDIVFSLDSVITAVGMTNNLPVMYAAVIVAVGTMLWASGPISGFVHRHPTVKMLALAFLLLVGVALIADGLQFHIPRGYLYFAIAFSLGVEALNLLAKRRQARKAGTTPGHS